MLKLKLKLIKGSLKEWHQQHSRNVEGKRKEAKERISFLDTKGEDTALLEDECVELRDLSVSLDSLARVHASMS